MSYLLIVYYIRNRSFNAGILTILINRFGDAILLVIISYLIINGSFEVYLLGDYNVLGEVISLLILLGAFTKRAQVPFSSWLPAAIAAPTPVSALVHSSTLVTAGIYILIRYLPGIEEITLNILVFFSLITLIMAGICANYEKDIKKIIALSTLRQLGVIIFVLGLGNVIVGYYHILIHAIFKALLFLCAGGFIHSIINYQDIRYIGGLGRISYFFRFGVNRCRIALIGFPFLAGFYSKDLICEYMLIGNLNFYFCLFFFIGVGLTRMYSVKLILMVFRFKKIFSMGVVLERKLIIKRIKLLIIGSWANGRLLG